LGEAEVPRVKFLLNVQIDIEHLYRANFFIFSHPDCDMHRESS